MPDCLPPNAAHPTDHFPRWAEEPPVPPEGSLVPGSRFHEEQWVMAAGMLARGASFQQVARAMGCSRTTLWRAYYGSQAFRHRVWWERQALNRESELRLGSLRALVTEQIERLVSSGDPSTVRWLAERLGLFRECDDPGARQAAAANPANPVTAAADPAPPESPLPGLDDDSVPGAIREHNPPDPKVIAAIVARPEAEGPKGVYPWTVNPDDPYPNLGSALERQGGEGAFPRRR
ncbi:hypothetical protein [Azospirillum palustre]